MIEHDDNVVDTQNYHHMLWYIESSSSYSDQLRTRVALRVLVRYFASTEVYNMYAYQLPYHPIPSHLSSTQCRPILKPATLAIPPPLSFYLIKRLANTIFPFLLTKQNNAYTL